VLGIAAWNCRRAIIAPRAITARNAAPSRAHPSPGRAAARRRGQRGQLGQRKNRALRQRLRDAGISAGRGMRAPARARPCAVQQRGGCPASRSPATAPRPGTSVTRRPDLQRGDGPVPRSPLKPRSRRSAHVGAAVERCAMPRRNGVRATVLKQHVGGAPTHAGSQDNRSKRRARASGPGRKCLLARGSGPGTK